MSTEQPLRVIVVGAGHMGRHHARIYANTPGCRLVAVVDKDEGRAFQIASEFGGDACRSVADFAGDIDAATVAVPTVYHAEVAVPLLDRGVAVLVEKPLAQDSATARHLLEASRRTGSLLQVGHSERFNPVVQAMLRMNIAARFIETQRVSPFTFRSADVGVVFDMMIHDIDIVLHLVRSRECTVDAVGVAVLGSCEDVANARLRFGGEAAANLTASRLALKTERRIRVFSPTAYLTMDYHKKTGLAIKVADNIDLIRIARERNFEDLAQMSSMDFGSMVKVEPLHVGDVEPLRAEIESFLAAVRQKKSALTGSSKALGSDRAGAGGSTAIGPHASSAASAEEGYDAVVLAERITAAVRENDWGGVLGEHHRHGRD